MATELPLEIRIVGVNRDGLFDDAISVTMRTPGDDAAMAIGYLVSERVLRRRDDLVSVKVSDDASIVRVRLRKGVEVAWDRLRRSGVTNSSCGVCGKASLSALDDAMAAALPIGQPSLDPRWIVRLPDHLRASQLLFSKTGGVHASGLFTADGRLIRLAEDVGRHNALDKVIGAQWMEDADVLRQSVLVVSGRVSFELVQKSLVAGIAILIAVGAPSSLAVEMAQKYGLTLVGFTKPTSYNLYHDVGRIHS